jgi:hypothetical protein
MMTNNGKKNGKKNGSKMGEMGEKWEKDGSFWMKPSCTVCTKNGREW